MLRQISRQIKTGQKCQKFYYSSEGNNNTSVVPLTSERYQNVKRGNYANLEENDVKFFESILGTNRVLTQEDELNGYNTGVKTYLSFFRFFCLRTEVRADFNIQGTRYIFLGCCFPCKPKQVVQKTRPFHEILTWTGYIFNNFFLFLRFSFCVI